MLSFSALNLKDDSTCVLHWRLRAAGQVQTCPGPSRPKCVGRNRNEIHPLCFCGVTPRQRYESSSSITASLTPCPDPDTCRLLSPPGDSTSGPMLTTASLLSSSTYLRYNKSFSMAGPALLFFQSCRPHTRSKRTSFS